MVYLKYRKSDSSKSENGYTRPVLHLCHLPCRSYSYTPTTNYQLFLQQLKKKKIHMDEENCSWLIWCPLLGFYIKVVEFFLFEIYSESWTWVGQSRTTLNWKVIVYDYGFTIYTIFDECGMASGGTSEDCLQSLHSTFIFTPQEWDCWSSDPHPPIQHPNDDEVVGGWSNRGSFIGFDK